MVSRNETHDGNWGWAGVAAGVLVFDLLSEESMSHAFSRYPKPVAIGALALVGAHLLDVIPEHLDPIDNFFKHVSEGLRRG